MLPPRLNASMQTHIDGTRGMQCLSKEKYALLCTAMLSTSGSQVAILNIIELTSQETKRHASFERYTFDKSAHMPLSILWLSYLDHTLERLWKTREHFGSLR